MTEQEMVQEIDRLRRELAETRKERDYFHKVICHSIPVDPPEVMEEKIREMMKHPMYTIDDIIQDLLNDGRDTLPPNNQIPA